MIDKGQWWEFGQDTGVTPLLFTRSALGFLMTTESQDLGLTSHPKDGAFYSIVSLSPTQTTGWAPPAGLTNTSSSSNLVFPGGLPSRYWPGSTLLSFSGQPVLGCRVIWLPVIYLLHLCNAFLGTQSALHRRGNLLNHQQCAASTRMMRRQPYCARTPTTHQLTGGEETEWWSQSVYGDD